MKVKYRNEDGTCKHCGARENTYHLNNCPVYLASIAHHAIMDEGFLETQEQLAQWDIQDHPMGTGPDRRLLQYTDVNLDLRKGTELENIFRDKCEREFAGGDGTYWDILLEEVFEAGSEEDPIALEKELVQVIAVAASMIAASRRARGA